MKIILPAFIAICMAAYVSAQTAEQEYQFMVEISGVNAGYFKGVDGLSAELEVRNERCRQSHPGDYTTMTT